MFQCEHGQCICCSVINVSMDFAVKTLPDVARCSSGNSFDVANIAVLTVSAMIFALKTHFMARCGQCRLEFYSANTV